MRITLGVLGALALLAAAGGAIADSPVAAPRMAPKYMQRAGWTLTFDGTFKGQALDRRRWLDSYPDGVRTHSNNEQEYYAPEAVTVRDGRLILTATKQPQGKMPYTSGMVSSYGKFSQRYGWFEIRARFPAGKGYWPAFWLLPADKSWPPEIDVLEILGHEPNIVYMTNHYRNAAGRHEGKGDKFVGPDFSKGMHTFAVDWEPGEIVWYVDGFERYHTTENVPDVPMYVIANLAVGGDWPGMPDASTSFPNAMEVESIRVYQKKGG